MKGNCTQKCVLQNLRVVRSLLRTAILATSLIKAVKKLQPKPKKKKVVVVHVAAPLKEKTESKGE